MASQAKLTLRAPPHVEFVQGWPGIPPQLPDRPPASVKGDVELRLTSPLKAKWVKVELRKIETLPGGGQANTYIDMIGESPLTVWQAKGEWDELQTHDFPFQIRIPETVPPSIALERGAGIKYELVASVFVKGKKGLLRRETTPTLTTVQSIVIDKHELHSTWPIYAQPESRSRSGDGYTLMVNRTHTCYAPGDRIAVQTILKNDTRQTSNVKYYEFSLFELIAFRPGAQAGGRRSGPQIKKNTIQEQRIPITISSPLQPGMQAKAELSLQVPPQHTTTTVSWGQRIEVSYVIHVKTVLSTNMSLTLDLPVTMTNWTRAQSTEAVRRIGTAPNLSIPQSLGAAGNRLSASDPTNARYLQIQQLQAQLQPPGMPQQRNQGNDWAARPELPGPNGFAVNPTGFPGANGTANGFTPNTGGGGPLGPGGFAFASTLNGPARPMSSVNGFNNGTLPASGSGNSENGWTPPGQRSPYDEFGSTGQRPMTIAGPPIQSYLSSNPGDQRNPNPNGLPNGSGRTSSVTSEEERRRKQSARPGGRSFAVVNVDVDENAAASAADKPAQPTYLTAEEEKRQMRAAADAAYRPGGSSSQRPAPQTVSTARPSSPPNYARPPDVPESAPTITPPPTAGGSSASASANQQRSWMTAEDEKRMLAQQTQLFETARTNVMRTQGGGSSGSSALQFSGSSENRGAPPPMNTSASTPWISAEEEKARLANQTSRYEQARAAVEQTQGIMLSSSGGGQSSSQYSNTFSPTSPQRSSTANTQPTSPGAALYSYAKSQMKTANNNSPLQGGSYPTDAFSSMNSSSQAPRFPAQQYLTAAEEKEQMRYQQAIGQAQAYHSSMSEGSAAPIAYDELYPTSPPQQAPVTASLAVIRPLSVGGSRNSYHAPSPPAGFGPSLSPVGTSELPLPPGFGGINQPQAPILDAKTEKERMRKLFEQQDSAARGAPVPPPPAARILTPDSGLPGYGAPPPQALAPNSPDTQPFYTPRSPPALPNTPAIGAARPLTAVEEKALLRAQFADTPEYGSAPYAPDYFGGNTHSNSTSPTSGLGLPSTSPAAFGISPPPPPPVVTPNSVHSPLASPGSGISPSLMAGDDDYRDSAYESVTRDPSIAKGKKKATAEEIPPPLAPKPPVEYYKYEPEVPPDAMGEERPGTRWNRESMQFEPINFRPLSPFDSGMFSDHSRSFVAPPPPPPLPPKVPL